MTPEDHPCFVEGCLNPATFGYRAVRTQPQKWACREHRHLLESKAAPAAPVGKPSTDLFGKKE